MQLGPVTITYPALAGFAKKLGVTFGDWKDVEIRRGATPLDEKAQVSSIPSVNPDTTGVTNIETGTIWIKDNIVSTKDHARTLFHELIHWSGPALGRIDSTAVGYFAEEITAELGANILGRTLGFLSDDEWFEITPDYIGSYADNQPFYEPNAFVEAQLPDALEAAQYLIAKGK